MSDTKKVKCEILRDTWDGNGVRQPKGTVVELDTEVAMDAIEAGSVKRVKATKKAAD